MGEAGRDPGVPLPRAKLANRPGKGRIFLDSEWEVPAGLPCASLLSLHAVRPCPVGSLRLLRDVLLPRSTLVVFHAQFSLPGVLCFMFSRYRSADGVHASTPQRLAPRRHASCVRPLRMPPCGEPRRDGNEVSAFNLSSYDQGGARLSSRTRGRVVGMLQRTVRDR